MFSTSIDNFLHLKLHTILFWIAETRVHLTIFWVFVLLVVASLSIYLTHFQQIKRDLALENRRLTQVPSHGEDMLHCFQSVDETDTEAAFAPDATYCPKTGRICCQYTSSFKNKSCDTIPDPPLELVKQLGTAFGGMEIGMGTCALDSWFQSFWLRAPNNENDNDNDRTASTSSKKSGKRNTNIPLTATEIRNAFGNAINLDAVITVAPFIRGGGEWWTQVLEDCAGSENEGQMLQKWDELIDWFSDNIGTAYFVSVDPGQEMLMGFSERLRCVVARTPRALIGVLGCVVIMTKQQQIKAKELADKDEVRYAQGLANAWM